MATVRDMVRAIQGELLTSDVTPHRAAEIDTRLSALIGNCLAEIREADAAYAGVLMAALESEAKANRARIKAECSPEFQRKREAKDTHALVVEMVRSCRNLCRVETEAMRMQR